MENTTFHLAFSKPLQPGVDPKSTRTDYIRVDPDVTSLSFSTGIGGFTQAMVGYEDRFFVNEQVVQRAYLERPTDIRPFGHCEIYADGALVWEGRVKRPIYQGGQIRGAELQGYGVWATKDNVFHLDSGSQLSGQAMLISALSTAHPAFTPQNVLKFVEPGVSHSYSEFFLQTANQVIDQMSKAGGSVNAPFDFFCYAGRNVSFVPRQAPATPDYVVPWDADVTDWTEDYEETYGTLTLQYTDFYTGAAATPITVSDPSFVGRYGLSRELVVQGGTKTREDAYQFANTTLAVKRFPVMAGKFKRDNERGVMRGGIQELPVYTLRAGHWVQMGAVGDKPLVMVVLTKYDAHQRHGEVELGAPIPGNVAMLSELRTTQKHVVKGTVPTSGAKH